MRHRGLSDPGERDHRGGGKVPAVPGRVLVLAATGESSRRPGAVQLRAAETFPSLRGVTRPAGARCSTSQAHERRTQVVTLPPLVHRRRTHAPCVGDDVAGRAEVQVDRGALAAGPRTLAESRRARGASRRSGDGRSSRVGVDCPIEGPRRPPRAASRPVVVMRCPTHDLNRASVASRSSTHELDWRDGAVRSGTLAQHPRTLGERPTIEARLASIVVDDRSTRDPGARAQALDRPTHGLDASLDRVRGRIDG